MRSGSASSSTIAADFPPSSSAIRFICSPQTLPISRPTGVDPVNVTMSTSGWATRWRPGSAPPGRMLTTPSGRPASSMIRASSRASSGTSGDGFTTTVHPASSAGMSLPMMITCGTLNAGMAATTPTGSRRISYGPYGPRSVSLHSVARAAATKPSIIVAMLPTWPIWENSSGEPFSRVTSSAISSSRAA